MGGKSPPQITFVSQLNPAQSTENHGLQNINPLILRTWTNFSSHTYLQLLHNSLMFQNPEVSEMSGLTSFRICDKTKCEWGNFKTLAPSPFLRNIYSHTRETLSNKITFLITWIVSCLFNNFKSSTRYISFLWNYFKSKWIEFYYNYLQFWGDK